jgi:hypothetical protein
VSAEPQRTVSEEHTGTTRIQHCWLDSTAGTSDKSLSEPVSIEAYRTRPGPLFDESVRLDRDWSLLGPTNPLVSRGEDPAGRGRGCAAEPDQAGRGADPARVTLRTGLPETLPPRSPNLVTQRRYADRRDRKSTVDRDPRRPGIPRRLKVTLLTLGRHPVRDAGAVPLVLSDRL